MTLKATAIPSTERLLREARECIQAFIDAATVRHYSQSMFAVPPEPFEAFQYRCAIDRQRPPHKNPGHDADWMEDAALGKAAAVLRAMERRRGR